jgi:site-specific DNA-methyltransferase (adenine-specific)
MTSPPYWALRDYGIEGQLGLEPDFREYISRLLQVFDELNRVLKRTGSFYLNLGDTYSRGRLVPAKCMIGIPWRIALALIDNGWILRNDVVWNRPNSMPSSVKDRLSNTYEHIFHLVKSKKYYYNLDAIRIPHKFAAKPFNIRVRDAQRGRLQSKWGTLAHASEQEVKTYDEKNYSKYPPHEPRHFQLLSMGIAHGGHTGKTVRHDHPLGKNPGDLWKINSKPHPFAHFAVYPEEICVRPILSSCPTQVCVKCGTPRLPTGQSCECNERFRPGIVLDMFAGSGTTLVVAKKLGRDFIGIELNPEYVKLARRRLTDVSRTIAASSV